MKLPAFQKRMYYMHCGLLQKKSKEWGHGISRGIEEHMEIPGIK